MNVKAYLDQHRVDYKVYPHAEECDAAHAAAALHVPGANFAKTVLLRADHGFRYVVVVLPSTSRLDLERVRAALGGADLRLATELEVVERNPGCEAGVLTPFGSQIGADTIADASLADHADLFFGGDNHQECIRLNFHEYCRLEHPLILAVAESGVKTPRCDETHVGGR